MGTTFKIYLPCVQEQGAVLEADSRPRERATQGSETILLVEDEHAVRSATGEFLRMQGYTVLEAKDGMEALEAAKKCTEPIHLVVTDVVMPNMSGGQLANELAQWRPETSFIFVSGYAGQTVLNHKVIDLETNFVQKPYTLKQLSGKIRAALDKKAQAQA
jgi:DNA-binding NtrC family response regulator